MRACFRSRGCYSGIRHQNHICDPSVRPSVPYHILFLIRRFFASSRCQYATITWRLAPGTGLRPPSLKDSFLLAKCQYKGGLLGGRPQPCSRGIFSSHHTDTCDILSGHGSCERYLMILSGSLQGKMGVFFCHFKILRTDDLYMTDTTKQPKAGPEAWF